MTGETNVLPVAAIQEGTVIDHIRAGAALQIVQFLKLDQHQKPVTLGLNLPSKQLGTKDLIKVVGYNLNQHESNCLAVFSLELTINIIENYKVIDKLAANIPEMIKGVIPCPNPRCISNHQEQTTSCLLVHRHIKGRIQLQCRFCRNYFSKKPC